MIQVPRFNSGDALSREYLDTLSLAITELQNRENETPNTNSELSGIIQIINNSGSDLIAFDVLGIEGPYIDPSSGDEEEILFQCGEPVLSGITPADPDHLGKFAILLEPIASGQIGNARVTGSSQAWVDIQTVGDAYADILDADATKLISGSSGMARILWTATETTGEQWALVQLGGSGGAVAEAPGIWAMIDGSTAISGATYRWTYQWHEVQPNEEGTWVAKEGGYTHSTLGVAYNTMEANNGPTGLQGNGVNMASLPVGVGLLPIGDAVVPLRLIRDCHDQPMPVFTAANALGGTC